MPSTEPQRSHRMGLIRRTLVRRRWPIFVQWSLLTVALSLTAYLLLVGPFRAVTLLRVDPTASDLFGLKAGGDSLDSYLQTQVQLIRSPNVLSTAATNPKAAVLARIAGSKDVIQELRKAISVSVVPDTYLLEVAMNSDSSMEAATVVNAVVDAFMEANSEWSDGMARSQIRNLEAYSVDLKNQTDELERRWKTLVAKGDVDLMAKQSNLISAEQGAKISEKLVEIDLDRLEAQAQLEILRTRQSKDQGRIEELETRVGAANILERALNARKASGGFEPKALKTDAVEVSLIQEERKTIREMQESVTRRLEQLRFEAKGEARIRPVNSALPPGRRVELWYRPLVLALIPFATFAFVLTCYSGVEAWLGSSVRAAKVSSPEEA